MGDVGTKMGNRNHIGGIHDQHAHVAMIWMIIVGSMTDHEIGLPIADQTANRPAIFHGDHEFPVVDIEDLNLVSEDFSASLNLRGAPPGQGSSGQAPMTNVAIGARYEFDVVAEGSPFRSGSPGAEFTIVRVCPEDDGPQFPVPERRLSFDALAQKRVCCQGGPDAGYEIEESAPRDRGRRGKTKSLYGAGHPTESRGNSA